jgi:hypothetical protein
MEINMSLDRTKKMRVVPVIRQGGWLSAINKDHDGLHTYTGATRRYTLPFSLSTRSLVNPFESEEQREELEKELSLPSGSLSIYKKKDNYWSTFEVILDKKELTLDLRNPEDVLRYLLLLANREEIAPSFKDRFEGSFKYALVDQDSESNERAKKAHTVKEAYKKLGQMEDSVETMSNFLIVYGKKPGNNPRQEFLVSEIDKIIENDLHGFMAIVEDEDFEMKLLIKKAIEIGAINKPSKTRYELPGGDVIGNSLQEVVDYLNNPLNQENYILIKNRIEVTD